MFFNEGRAVINCADGGYFLVLDRFNVLDSTKVHDIIKVEREKMNTVLKVEKEEKDASKEELKTNDSN